MINSIQRLFDCIRNLGFRSGWHYWKMQNLCIKSPGTALVFAESCRELAEEDPKSAELWLDFAAKIENHYEKYVSSRTPT